MLLYAYGTVISFSYSLAAWLLHADVRIRRSRVNERSAVKGTLDLLGSADVAEL